MHELCDFEDDDGFIRGDLNGEDEDSRRHAIMGASRAKDASCTPSLLALLETDTYANRRHIIRALGNIRSEASESRLLELLKSEEGMILGDLAGTLGKLTSCAALPRLRELEQHQIEWVAQNARAALRMIGKVHGPGE
jgi:HEAT repeat protein